MPRPRAPSQARLRVGFILARRFTLCAFANFVDVLRLAADEGDRSRPILCEWSILSDTMEPIASSCGVVVQPTARLGDPKSFDYIVVVGGLMQEIPNLAPATLAYLQRAAREHVPLAGVCTGAFILHRAGLMDGYRCCVSWFHHADFLEQFDGLRPVADQIFMVDRDRLTCSGGASSAHLAAWLVEKHVGIGPARKSLQIMIIDEALRGEKPQPATPIDVSSSDDAVRKAILHMRQNVETPLSVEELARRLGLSRRSLERHFEKAVGRSPSAYYVALRLDQADLLFRTSRQTVAAIAAATGFCDGSHLARAFRTNGRAMPQRPATSAPASMP
ncbi:GlxA family transcriptional regulator [Aureimonas psammosilenae]|uniref:GlxA family transcriptional regulator n=1 Tax=Aureimonas psammosilenae TaxID=2495496 RepID=UPI001F1DEF50|nr:GlxA family transcriptional regulator [Aureimonas psammosilenae]